MSTEEGHLPSGAARSPRLIRIAEVIDRCALSKTTIYDRIRKGTFPPPADLGGVVAWSEAEVEDWIAARLAERTAVHRAAAAFCSLPAIQGGRRSTANAKED